MGIDLGLKNHPRMYDFLIIGAGPAGMTAAIYAKRAALKVGFIEKDAPGGKMVKTGSLENYPGFTTIKGPDLSLAMLKQVLENEADYIYGKVTNIHKNGPYWDVTVEDGSHYYGRTVFVATGMIEKKIGIPNELEFYGKGVSYCAVCDGALYKKRDVIVIGGGNSAVEEAIYLSDIVKTVHIIHRRNEFRADKAVVDKMRSISNIKIYTPYIPIAVNTDGKLVNGITIQNTENKKIETISAACVFPYIGLDPVTDFLKNLNILDENNFVKVNENMQTEHDGLYAGGDVIVKNLRQVATAINDGAIAAISAKNYLSHKFKE